MKKTNFISFVLILVLFTAVSCGDDDDNDDSDVSPDDDTQSDDDLNDDLDDDVNDDVDDDINDDIDDDADDDTVPDRTPLFDRQGREVILHGGNFMAIEYDCVQEDYYQMVWQWGFNAVRILITWAGLEPEQGVYDENYLPNVVTPQLEYAANAGLNVILDMHQWQWSDCSDGMGMPTWICDDVGDFELEWLYQSGIFWNHPEYIDAFVAAWEKVAEFFAGDDRVFAYDLFNEPMAGLRTPPWFSENQLYRPLYIRLIDAIRAHHPEPYLIVEPTIIHAVGLPCVMDPIDAERLIYGPHLYPGTISWGGDYTFPRSRIERDVNYRLEETKRLQMPLLWGECGLRSDALNSMEFARDATDIMDEEMSHWLWWAYGYDENSMGICTSEGEPKPEFYPYLSRPYPRATAGLLVDSQFDSENFDYTLTFENNGDMEPESIIYLNTDYHYADGFDVSCSDPDGAWSFDFNEDTNLLTVHCDPAQAEHTITVTPRINSDRIIRFS